jgi:hypothetical protein
MARDEHIDEALDLVDRLRGEIEAFEASADENDDEGNEAKISSALQALNDVEGDLQGLVP